MEFATSLVQIVREYMTHPATEVSDSVLAGEIIGVLEPPYSVATYTLMINEFGEIRLCGFFTACSIAPQAPASGLSFVV
jgi:hypothetical protein